MIAVRVSTGRPLAPFGDDVGDAPVLNRPLREVQDAALVAAGLTRVEAAAAPTSEPYLCFGDSTWFTPELIRRFVAAWAVNASGAHQAARLCVTDPDFLRETGPLQPDVGGGTDGGGARRGRYFLEVRASGEVPGFEVGPGRDLIVDLALRHSPPNPPHAAFAHAYRGGVALGPAMVHEVWHWAHITRVNLLALAARAEEARAQWDHGGLLARLGLILPVLWRAKSLHPAPLARALLPIPRSAKIHPTAVIEACVIDEDVEVGPFACVRGSVLGRGCKIDAYASLNLAVVGARAQVGRGAMVNLCVLYEGAFVSSGGGFQMCVFGRDSFVAMTATMLDLSFGRTIKVDTPEGRGDTEGYFLGGAIGHRARIGAGVRIGYGVAIPNDTLLVAPSGDLVRRVEGEAVKGEVLSAVEGVARAVARPAALPCARPGVGTTETRRHGGDK